MTIHDTGAKLRPAGTLAAAVQAPDPGAVIEKAPPTLKLATSLFLPHLERLPASCPNCKFVGFKVIVSPLLGQHKGACVIRRIECVKCGTWCPVEDGMMHGRRPNAHKPLRRVR